MKKYLILRANIAEMGGAQMYVRNKAVFKSREGYSPYVISSRPGEIFIEDLKRFKSGVFPELQLTPNCFPPKKLRRMLDRLLAYIGYEPGDEIFIESNDVIMSLWGELIAAEVKAEKNVLFILNEHFSDFEKHFKPFFQFKQSRGELAGIRRAFLAEYFGDKDITAYHWLTAVISNNVDDCDHPVLSQIDASKINIASIGRLDKSYVPTLTDELKKVAENHPQKEFDITFIGDSQESAVKTEIEKKLGGVSNLRFRITGFMYPIPRRLFPMIDVFVSAAGSAWSSYHEKRPTVSIDVDTHKAIGVLGHNTIHTLRALESDTPVPISEAVEAVLFGSAAQCDYKKVSGREPLEALSLHDDYWNESTAPVTYFDVTEIPKTKAEKLLNGFMRVFGTGFTANVLFRNVQKIRKK